MSEIHILNTDLEWVQTIDDGVSLVWADIYDKKGKFELNLPYYYKDNEYLVAGNYATIRDPNNDSSRFMIIEDKEIIDSQDGSSVKLTGASGESLLEARVILEPFTVDGNINDAVKSLVTDHFISPSDPNRTIPHIYWEDNAVLQNASLYSVTDMFESGHVYDIIEKLCQAIGVGFKAVISDTPTKAITFSVYVGIDRSHLQSAVSRVVFSPEFDNVLETDTLYSTRANKNHVLMLTDDTLPSNQVVPVYIASSEPTGLARKETYNELSIARTSVDPPLTDTEVFNIITANGVDLLNNRQPVSIFDGEFDVTQPFIYGIDFQLGDLVQCDVAGIPIRARITETVVSLDESQFKRHVSFEFDIN